MDIVQGWRETRNAYRIFGHLRLEVADRIIFILTLGSFGVTGTALRYELVKIRGEHKPR